MTRWIPVSERLPEDPDGSLVTVNGTYKNITFVHAIELAIYDKAEGWILEAYPDWLEPNVTAWMPLPQPYMGGEQNETTRSNRNNKNSPCRS